MYLYVRVLKKRKGDIMVTNRLENESIKDYKIRLFRNKDFYNLTLQQITDLINNETNENLSETTYRKWFRPYQEGYEDGLADASINDLDIKQQEQFELLEKNKVKFRDQRNGWNELIRNQARFEENLEILKSSINKLNPYDSNIVNIQNSDNDLMIGLNDIHFGADISNYWNTYNSHIAKLRLEKYLANIFKIRETHNSENAYVFANGDLISGNIHTKIKVANRESVLEQITGVSELISWFLAELSSKFNKVYFANVAGNHSRIEKKEDALTQDRLDNLVPWYCKARLQNIDNIYYVDNEIDTTFNIVDIRGKNFLNIHGDYDGIKSIERILSLIDKEIYCFHFGHLHHNMTDYIQKYKIIMSGSLMGMDEYCIEKRIVGKAQQLVAVCNSNGILCTYDLILQ